MTDLSRNHVIEAGAGTGKTYTLVQALLQAVFQKNLPLTSIVALTFTKKAAGEMKERVAGELQNILAAERVPEAYQSWGRRLEDLQATARAALEAIDRANISTIHSFAFSLLKRFPLAAGVNPESEVDEKGLRYADLFALEWPRWLAVELGHQARHKDEWLEILAQLNLSDIEEAARLLCDFRAPLWSLPIADDDLAKRLAPLYDRIQSLSAAHPGEDKTGRLAAVCEEVFRRTIDGSLCSRLPGESRALHTTGGPGPPAVWGAGVRRNDDYRDLNLEPGAPKAWSKDELRELKYFRKIAQNLVAGGDRLIRLLSERLRPFAARFRAAALAEGYLSNDALVALACELVRRDHDIRKILKEEFRMILVDEFQDTDPLQGELLLFLSEKTAGHAKRWDEVHLEPGKLFVVGDPKQSIYRFRGADIAAYRQITAMILGQGGISSALQTSRRSHDAIIHAVNEAFVKIIRENKMISPAYVPLEPLRARAGLALQGVELCLADAAQAQRSDEAQASEAEFAAAWIAENVGRLECLDKKQGRGPLAYRDIALVFRSTPPMRAFVEALRRREIPFVVEGERYFYSTPEVTDMINFLRVIENPRDRIALVGFLRSPLGGFTDAEILALREAKRLNAQLPLPPSFGEAHQRLWRFVQSRHHRVGRAPLKVLLADLFEGSFILELAARSYHRDQTVANVLKLKRLLEAFAEEGVTTLRSLLQKVTRFMEDDRLEGESPLADDTYDAVRLLTIHKAKGLEFPVIWLPSLHAGRRSGQTEALSYDWSSGRLGLRVGGFQNLDKLLLDWEAQEREREEEKRVLYVAMTRARERMILSGGVNLLRPSADSYFEWLRSAWKLQWDAVNSGPMIVGKANMTCTRLSDAVPERSAGAPRPTPKRFLDLLDPKAFGARWEERRRQGRATLAARPIRRPTDAAAWTPAEENGGSIEPSALRPEEARLLGTLVHRFLERWDFACGEKELRPALEAVSRAYWSSLGVLHDAFLTDEAERLLRAFLRSPDYRELAGATILGREVPFIYQAEGAQLVRGTMDVLYRTPAGALIVGDYKTDRAGASANAHEAQGAAYQEAVEKALGRRPEFKLIYLSAHLIPHLS